MKVPLNVAIIGAGCSGLTAVKNLIQLGIKSVTCFEQNPWIGGNWKYTSETSHSSVCSTTHIISSKKLSEYTDFPMPDHYPDYPSHEQVLAYFESYTNHFELRPYIRFNTKVNKAVKIENERWRLYLQNGTIEEFDCLMIANGHHSEARHPEFKDDFTGRYMHAHEFKSNKSFAGEKVLVVGAGNSACDCAVEISRVAKEVDISIRTPQYIVPKFFLGRPSDTFNERMRWIPNFFRNFLLKMSLKIQIGSYEDYGLEKPKHGILEAHPTLNSELLYNIRHGKVKPRPGIKKVDGKTVYFVDEERKDYDTVMAATGYKIWTPFFDSDFLDYSEADKVPLYLRMFHPEHKTLIFIGLFQPQGAIWPASDLQSRLAGNYILGEYKLPVNIAQLAVQDAEEISKRYLKRKRHTIEVDYHEFYNRLWKELTG